MAEYCESSLDRLWEEYSRVFRDFDDLTLGRWMAQTLGQLQGRAWRASHPLVGAYRLACRWAHDRQIWLKRLATAPAAYPEAGCCRAPLLVLLNRDVIEAGLLCEHCRDTAVPFDEIPGEVRPALKEWAEAYAPVHAVAHWDEAQQRQAGDYDQAKETAAVAAEKFLATAGTQLASRLLEFYPVVIWEDQDECLDVCPEDIPV